MLAVHVSINALDLCVSGMNRETCLTEFKSTVLGRDLPFTLPRLIEQVNINVHCSATRGLFPTDHVILNHGQVTWATSELTSPSPNYHTNGRFELSTDLTCIAPLYGGVFSGTGLELVTRQATIRYLDHSATAATPITHGKC
ncbi:hypothetical protein TNCV_199971 [Trichonephila clavipes]|nr:hypothetical protein TNCV_199971 [Trichonephila clavipes]